MREKFELCCKVVGLAVFCYGFYYSLSSIPLFFQGEPDVSKMYGEELLQKIHPGLVNQLKESMAYTWKYILKLLILHGIVPMLMGIYLMRSNNLFVRLCYPLAGSSPKSPQNDDKSTELTLSKETSKKRNEETSDSQFAPPGYFQ